MVDTRHLKCRERKLVPVQVRPAVIKEKEDIFQFLVRVFQNLDPQESFH